MTREEAVRIATSLTTTASERDAMIARLLEHYRLSRSEGDPWHATTIEGRTSYRMKPGYLEKKIVKWKVKNPRSPVPDWM